jgi:methylenetetrahydrofolate dehydrogenase (NADP+)/methenyltetrahydrofolate cyclohydrolase
MIVDGRAIALALKERVDRRVAASGSAPSLAIVVVGENPVIESFVRIKKRFANEVGIAMKEYRFPDGISTDELKQEVARLGKDKHYDGIVVQLPLSEGADTQAILDTIPVEKDVDVLSRNAMGEFRKGTSKVLPPVASAIQEILEHHEVSVVGKDVLVLGHGRLVGAPSAMLMRHNHAHVTVVDKEIEHLSTLTHDADVIISGVGKPGLIVPDMLKQGVVLIDAATSESEGRIVGDVDPSCAEIASLYTPVPGGVGPITVAALFKNLTILAEARRR